MNEALIKKESGENHSKNTSKISIKEDDDKDHHIVKEP